MDEFKPDDGSVADLRDRFESDWRRGETVRLEDFLAQVGEAERSDAAAQLMGLEVALRRERGEDPAPAEYELRFPKLSDVVRSVFASGAALATVAHQPQRSPHRTGRGLHVRCCHCRAPIELVPDAPLDKVDCPSCGSRFSLTGQEGATRDARSITEFGQFELVERLGMGAYGTVWKARDTQLDRTVAIKVPRKGELSTEETEKFLREARSAAQLRHPNIVPVHEVGREGDTLYIVSDFIRGVPLSEAIADSKFTFRETCEILVKVAEALHHAHEKGVVHRDLKPQNIMLDDSGEPHLMDFGLAKREAGEITMTVEGAILGTPAYMSPEQAKGEAHNVDRTSDIYSLGVILFEMLTGELPFRGTPRMLIHKVINDEAPSPRRLDNQVPRDLETICLKCLEKDSKRRYPSAKEVAAELNRFLAGESIQGRPVGRTARGWRWAKRKPLAASLLTVVALLAIAGPLIATREFRLTMQLKSVLRDREQAQLDAQRQVTKLHLGTATHFYDTDQLDAGLLWNARAWQEDSEANVNEAEHRLRLGLGILEKPELVGLAIHDSPIADAKIDESGEIVFALTTKGTATLWRIRSGTVLAGPLPHPGEVTAIDLSADGTWAVSAGKDGTARVWNVTTGKQTHVVTHGSAIEAIAIRPHSEEFATAGGKEGIRFWDRKTGNPLLPAIDVSGAYYLTYDPTGKNLASADSNGFARVWSPETREAVSRPLEFPIRVGGELEFDLRRGPVFSPDGSRIVVAAGKYMSDDPHRISLRRRDGALAWGPARGFAHDQTFDSSGQYLLAAGSTAVVYDAETGEILSKITTPRECQRVAFLSDYRVATASTGGEVQFWDVSRQIGSQAGKVKLESQPAVSTASVRCADTVRVLESVNGGLLLVGSGDGTIRLYDTQIRQREIPQIMTARRDLVPLQYESLKLYLSHDGQKECVIDDQGRAVLSLLAEKSSTLLDVSSPVERVFFCENGDVLVTANRKEMQAWSARDGKPWGPVVALAAEGVTRLVVSGNGRRAAMGHAGRRTVCVVDLQSGETLFQQEYAHTDPMWGNDFVLSFDGQWLVTGDYTFAGCLEVWDLEKGQRVQQFYPQRGVASDIDMASDSLKLLVCSSDTTARLWDAWSGHPLGPVLRHARFCRSGQIAPNGKLVVTSDAVGNVYLWDGIKGMRFARWSVDPSGNRMEVWFADDGNSIEVLSNGKTYSLPIRPTGISNEAVAPLMDLLTGKRIDPDSDGIDFVPSDAFMGDPRPYLTAWQEWRKSLDDGLDKEIRDTTQPMTSLSPPDEKQLLAPSLELFVAALREKLGSEDEATRRALFYLAKCYGDLGRWTEAIPLLEQVVASHRAELGGDHADTHTATTLLATAYQRVNRADKALPLFEELLVSVEALREDDPRTLKEMLDLATLAMEFGQHKMAVDLYDKLLTLQKKKLGFRNPETTRTHNAIARLLATSPMDEVRDGKRAIQLATIACGLTAYKDSGFLDTLAAAYAETGDFENSVKWSQRAIDLLGEDVDEATRQEYVAALNRYKNKQPTRIEAGEAKKQADE